MDINLLTESHNFRNGDRVIVKRRYTDESYEGIIHSIINMPIDKYTNNNNKYIDYFYISFNLETYNRILFRGLEVIHKNVPKVLGDVNKNKEGKITTMFLQHGLGSHESEIDINDITACLIWRVAYEILPPI